MVGGRNLVGERGDSLSVGDVARGMLVTQTGILERRGGRG